MNIAEQGRGLAGGHRVFFHIGAPKTGTTFLQSVLAANRERLAEQGLLYAIQSQQESFEATRDFVGQGWARRPAAVFKGKWEVIAERCRAWPGTVVISNELLGGASLQRVEAGIASILPAEVHVVFTARDLGRQLVSDWQEQVKHKHTVTLEKFVGELIEQGLDAPAPFGQMFWGLHDAPYILARWAPLVPRERIHVVTVPRPGAPSATLWRRFASVLGLDPEGYDLNVRRTNPSMGVAETELVRRLNFELKRIPARQYDALVRLNLAEQVLGGGKPGLTLPPERLPWVVERSKRLVAELREARYDVVGDLDELIPAADDLPDHVSPTGLSDRDLAEASLKAAAGAIKLAAKVREENLLLREQLAKPEPAPARPGEPAATTGHGPVRRLVGKTLRRARAVRERLR
ncbi:MAG TPA: hypothetical protein VFI30_01640 [Nocardioidaceae bacterium]|nr:hypothetical protein [Nocardioidaceae bacterium]